MVLVAELDGRPGRRLEAIVEYFPAKKEREPVSITPAVVRSAIELAISEGWQPESRGLPPYRLRDAGRILDGVVRTSE